jgi:hypothetical protein
MYRLSWIALVLIGCGNKTSTPSTDLAMGLSADQACADVATAYCMKLDACHVRGVALRYGDTATCVQRVKMNCLPSLGAKDTGRTPANQEACALAYPSASCSDFSQGTIAACAPPPGLRTAGSPCTYSAQCQTAFCSFSPGSQCGMCAVAPSVGDSCADGQCAAGQVCAEATTTCQSYGAAGAACSRSSECAPGLGCVDVTMSMPGTCQPAQQSAGQACDRVAGPICDYLQGIYCSIPPMMSAGSCVSYLYATAGQMCGYTAGSGTMGSSYTECIGGSSCWIPTGMNAGTCIANAQDGAACDRMVGPGCLAPARCVVQGGGSAGTCQLPDPTVCS